MTDLQTSHSAPAQMHSSLADLQEHLLAIKPAGCFNNENKKSLTLGFLSLPISPDVLSELPAGLKTVEQMALVALHPSFDLHTAAKLAEAWAAQDNIWFWEEESELSLAEIVKDYEVFLAYAAVSLANFWNFKLVPKNTEPEGVELALKENKKAFKGLLQSMEEGGFSLLEIALPLLQDAYSDDSFFGNHEEIISLCELAKNI